MSEKYTRERCVSLLRGMSEGLRGRGEERYPRRSDFSDAEVTAIKAFLGPWPRALEAAGLKPPRNDNQAQRTKAARARAKRRRRETDTGSTEE